MNYYKNDIRHVKGDTYSSNLIVEGLGQNIATAKFTCRDSLNDNSEVLFEKTLNNGIVKYKYDSEKDIRYYSIRIPPEDTQNLQSGTYYYDLEVGVNGDVFTIMKGRFIVEQDCSR